MPWQPNKLERERLDKLQRIKERGIDPYPNRVRQTHTAAQAIAEYEALEQDPARGREAAEAIEVAVTGRIRSVRVTGKIIFSHIEDGTDRVQLFVRQDAVGG